MRQEGILGLPPKGVAPAPDSQISALSQYVLRLHHLTNTAIVAVYHQEAGF